MLHIIIFFDEGVNKCQLINTFANSQTYNKFLIDASNNSIGFTYGYLRSTPLGLGYFRLGKNVDVSPRRG